jgi:MFS superfamily sulfate permease-like transporter
MHVFTAQLPGVLGVSVPRRAGLGCLFSTYVDLFRTMPNANVVSIIISAVAIALLFVCKEYINPMLKRHVRLPAPVPFELLLMIGTCILSYFTRLSNVYGVRVVGYIPNTFVWPPSVPSWSLIPSLLPDAFSIALVAYVVGVSMARLFAAKHNYRIDPDQEWLACGIVQVFAYSFHAYARPLQVTCSFAQVIPVSAALGRSLVYESAGVRTQLSGLFTGAMMLCVILFIGPLFEPLPTVSRRTLMRPGIHVCTVYSFVDCDCVIEGHVRTVQRVENTLQGVLD